MKPTPDECAICRASILRHQAQSHDQSVSIGSRWEDTDEANKAHKLHCPLSLQQGCGEHCQSPVWHAHAICECDALLRADLAKLEAYAAEVLQHNWGCLKMRPLASLRGLSSRLRSAGCLVWRVAITSQGCVTDDWLLARRAMRLLLGRLQPGQQAAQGQKPRLTQSDAQGPSWCSAHGNRKSLQCYAAVYVLHADTLLDLCKCRSPNSALACK